MTMQNPVTPEQPSFGLGITILNRPAKPGEQHGLQAVPLPPPAQASVTGHAIAADTVLNEQTIERTNPAAGGGG
jgi:hypothetical protein